MAQRGQSSFFLESFSHKLQNFVVIERQVAYTSKVQHIFPSQTMHPFSCLPCRRAGGSLAERFGDLNCGQVEPASTRSGDPWVAERWNLLIKRVGWDAKLRVSGWILVLDVLDEPFLCVFFSLIGAKVETPGIFRQSYC